MLRRLVVTGGIALVPITANGEVPSQPMGPPALPTANGAAHAAEPKALAAPWVPAGTLAEQVEGQNMVGRLIGSPVEDARGEPVGEIADLVVDRDGRIVGAVVTTGGFLGLGKREVGIQWSALRPLPDELGFRTEVPRGTLEAMTDFRTLEEAAAEREAVLREQLAGVARAAELPP